MNGNLVGTINRGALGAIPLVRIAAPKPKLSNNGFAVFCGHPRVSIPGLAAALRAADDHPIPQGHICVSYSDGSEFLTYAADMNGCDQYDLS